MTALRTNRLRTSGLGSELDRLFNGFFGPWQSAPAARSDSVRVNVWQHEDAFFVEAEVPGVREEDLDLAVRGNELTLKGRREGQQDFSFTRVVRLPVDVDADAVEASLTDGVLLVKLPQTAAMRPRKIQIKREA